jgi:hypothetical protein
MSLWNVAGASGEAVPQVELDEMEKRPLGDLDS